MIVTPRDNFGFSSRVQEIHREVEALRMRPNGGLDVSWKDHIAKKFQHDDGTAVTWEEFLNDLGVELNRMTIENLITAPYDTRWLVPEVIREAIRLGLRRSPIHPNIIRASETVEQPSQVMPYIEFSGDTTMDDTAEAETIGVGSVSYGSKTVNVHKKAKGIEFTYESIRFTNINLASIFFEDVGVRLGHTLDAMAISCIINGDVTGGTYSAPVLGVEDAADGITYYDLLRMWIHGGLIGRSWQTMIGDEDMILTVMDMAEYKNRQSSYDPKLNLNIHVPIVTSPEIYAHVSASSGTLIMQDNRFGLVQLTAIPLLVESEKIVNRQIEGTYASIMTGFAKLFRDSSLVLDSSVEFSNPSYDWPAWMTPTGWTS